MSVALMSVFILNRQIVMHEFKLRRALKQITFVTLMAILNLRNCDFRMGCIGVRKAADAGERGETILLLDVTNYSPWQRSNKLANCNKADNRSTPTHNLINSSYFSLSPKYSVTKIIYSRQI